MEEIALLPYELAVIQMKSNGLTDAEIALLLAGQLGASIDEVRVGSILDNIYTKTYFHRITPIVYFALKTGLIAGPPPTERLRPLSRAELFIMNLVKLGFTNAEIAERKGLSKKTVKRHMEDAFAAYHARNRPHLIALIVKDGTIE